MKPYHVALAGALLASSAAAQTAAAPDTHVELVAGLVEKLRARDACPAALAHEVPAPREADRVWPAMLFKFILREREKSYWNSYYARQCEFVEDALRRTRGIDATRDRFTLVEIGTAWGGNAAFMASRFAGAEIYAVDPLVPYDPNDGQSNIIKKFAMTHGLAREQVSLGWARALAADQAVRAGCRYHMLRTFSTEAVAALPAVDFAFIDGLHTYEGVVADIDAYFPRMAKGGVMIFNDYGSKRYPGVTRAVDEFVAREGLRLVVGGTVTPPGNTNAGVVLP